MKLKRESIFINLKKLLLITVGAFIMALGVSVFLVPSKVAAGGVTGISTVIYLKTGIPLGVSYLIINVFLFLWGFKTLPKKSLVYTVYATLISSVFLDFAEKYGILFDDFVISSVYGGALTGLGIGIVIINGASASAAEIVAGALGEQTRATVVGTRTFGKGSVQSVYSLENSNLYITSGYTYTPSGKRIDESGIVPQICTGISDSCVTSDNKDAFKDVLMAIKLIKNNLA